MEYTQEQKQLTKAAHRAYQGGFQRGTGGNISVLLPNEGSLLVKSAGGCFDDCEANGSGWTQIDFHGQPITKDGAAPTKEWRLHAAILSLNIHGLSAVVHCHSPWSIAWGEHHDEIPLVTWQAQLKLRFAIPVIHINSPIVPQKELYKITDLLIANPNLCAFVLKGHGIVAVGANPLEAEHTLELVEETAKICFLTQLESR